jgi:hypothetical protein
MITNTPEEEIVLTKTLKAIYETSDEEVKNEADRFAGFAAGRFIDENLDAIVDALGMEVVLTYVEETSAALAVILFKGAGITLEEVLGES